MFYQGQGTITKIDGTIQLLEAGLRAENLRQKAISTNIANLETPGYRRIDVKFEEMLQKAIDSDSKIAIENVMPELFNPKDSSVKSNGNDVSLDAEVGRMVENTLRHKTYVKLLNKKYQQLNMAMQVK